jgi:predicted nucleic acid-binding protein
VPSLVVDASVAAGWFIGDEASPYTEADIAAVYGGGALVPALWPYEVTNMLVTAERRGRISPTDVSAALDSIAALPLDVHPAEPMRATRTLARIAREQGLTAYDASYLELAMRTRSALATLDAALERAAHRAGVSIFPG